MEAGGAKNRTELYYASKNTWRVNITPLTYSASPYVDRAHGVDGYWSLTERQLQTARKLEAKSRGTRFNPKIVFDVAEIWITSWSTGVAWPAEAECVIEEVREHNKKTEIVVRVGPSKFILHVERPLGEEAWARFQVQSIEVVDPENGSPVAIMEFDGWQYHDDIGIDLAHHTLTTLANGQVETEHYVSRASLFEGNFSEITKMPAADSVDQFRGQMTYQSVINHTKSERSTLDDDSRKIIDRVKTDGSGPMGYRILLVISVIISAVFATVLLRRRSVL